MEPLLKVEGLTKIFPGIKALDGVDFDLYPGEVHILAGENGAGKSTLSKCILGVYQAEGGKMYYKGSEVHFHSPKEAIDAGISAVYQELTMIPYLNAAENIYFNKEPVYPKTGLIHHKKMREDAREILRLLHCEDIDVRQPVKNLGVARQQMIEIAKALSSNPDVIIFDEPTAALSDQEVDSLFEQIDILKKRGIGIIYVSHRMGEFCRIGDRISVLRDGKKIKTVRVGEISEDELVKLMVGRDIKQVYLRKENHYKEEALRVEGVSDRAGRVKECSLVIKRGEIVGLAGLVGAGRTELARLLYGIDPIKSGKVLLKGQDITGKSPKYIMEHGLGLLPEDRKGLGLAVRAPISWNVVSVSLKQLFPSFFLSKRKNDAIAEEAAASLKIAAANVQKEAGTLSGGNQQKVVLAKWLLANTDVIIFDEPTRGIDVGAKMEIYGMMDDLAAKGKAILMISSEMQEIIGMSDRIYVMKDGRIAGELKKGNITADHIGKLLLKEDTREEIEGIIEKREGRIHEN